MQTGAIGVNGNAVVLSKQSQFDKTLPTRASSPHQRDKNDLPNQKHGCGTKEHNLHWYSNNDGCGMFCGSVTWMLLLFAEYCIIHVVLDLKYVDLVRVDIISHINGNEMASVLNSNQQDGGNAATISSSSPSSISSNIDEQQGLSLAFKLLNAFLYSLFIILALTSHLRAMLTNPGATPHDAVPLEYNGDDNMKIQQERYCKYCDAYKPPRAHHCSICGRCIVKMDHHCPWVNNCVGVGNQKYFVLFLLYTFISCVYTLFLVGFKFGHCSNSRFKVAENGAIVLNDKVLPECEDLATRTILQILVIIEAILFGLFTFCMMCDQWNMAVFAETQIDRLKGGRRRGRKWTKCENLSEVFGGPPRFSFWWLLPVSFAYLNPDRIYGFRTRDKTSNVNRSSSTQDGSSSSSFDNQGHFNDIENEIVEPQSLPKASKEFIDPESQSDTRYESKRDD